MGVNFYYEQELEVAMVEYLAHISDDKSREQTVEMHLRSVSKFANVLGRKIGVGNIAALCGWLHDVGKLNDTFNAYIRQGDLQKSGKKGPDHSTAGAVYVVEKFKNSTVEKNDVYIDTLSQLVALVVMSHHSGLVDVWTGTESPYFKRLDKLQSDENWQLLYGQVLQNLPVNFENQVDELFAAALVEFKHICNEIENSNCANDYALGMLCKVLFSILIDADRYDTATFMDNIPMVEPADNQCLWDSYAKTLEDNLAKLPKDSAIDKLRWQISDTCLENAKNDSGIYTLNCPTGSGKTLASLRYAINHAKEFGKERIFYIIPFITITEQNAAVVREMLSLEANSGEILEIHSAVEVENLDFSKVEPETLNEHELLVERMEAPLVFTTMVRFLNTIFASGTKNMRSLHQFANSVIIFDEIQTISPKHIAIFNEAIKFLEKICNCTIILSTATQPALDNLPEDIPAIEFGKPKDIANCTEEMFKAFKRTKFVDCSQKAKTVDEIADFVWEKAIENESWRTSRYFLGNQRVRCLCGRMFLSHRQNKWHCLCRLLHYFRRYDQFHGGFLPQSTVAR